MSRFRDGYDDDYEPEAVLARGRWEHNARRALKSARGRKALAEIRQALLALPDKRLIEGALCTVGGPGRVPGVTDAEIDARVDKMQETGMWNTRYHSRDTIAGSMQSDREKERDAVAGSVRGQGCGVCVNGALLWHQLVKTGLTPDEAFASLPSVTTTGTSDPMEETALIAERDAGIAYTLAWELAYKNDQTFGAMTPEERWQAFMDWISAELGETAGAS